MAAQRDARGRFVKKGAELDWQGDQVDKTVRDAVREAMLAAGKEIERMAREDAPRRRPLYFESIKAAPISRRGENITGVVRGTRLIADRPGYQLEYGTKRNRKYPHIWPAFDRAIRALQAQLEGMFK